MDFKGVGPVERGLRATDGSIWRRGIKIAVVGHIIGSSGTELAWRINFSEYAVGGVEHRRKKETVYQKCN